MLTQSDRDGWMVYRKFVGKPFPNVEEANRRLTLLNWRYISPNYAAEFKGHILYTANFKDTTPVKCQIITTNTGYWCENERTMLKFIDDEVEILGRSLFKVQIGEKEFIYDLKSLSYGRIKIEAPTWEQLEALAKCI